MGSKIKPRQEENGRAPKRKRSIIIDSLRHYKGGPMKDRREKRKSNPNRFIDDSED